MFLNDPVGSQLVCQNTQKVVVYIVTSSELSQSKCKTAVRVTQLLPHLIADTHS